MYEQYTDKQIVEMLKPKLTKIMCGMDGMLDTVLEHSESGRNLIRLIATIYRSAYIRGQLGRSFIIGEKKRKADKTGCWVPVSGDRIKEGDSVRYINEEVQKNNPSYYPTKDVVGKVIKVCSNWTCQVQWPKGSTSGDDKWYAAWGNLEVLRDRGEDVKPVKAEKWVPVTKDNIKVGSKVRFKNEQLHKKHPQYFPCKGTVGEVRTVCKDGLCDIQWPKGTTSDMDWWVTKWEDLEVLLCE